MNPSGGCLCGKIRYEISAEPFGVVICSCRFCQRATGSDYLVEPLFEPADFKILTGKTTKYDHVSEGSGQTVTVNFCAECGTKLFHQVHRFDGCIGVFAGTLDNPSWFKRNAETVDFIFTDEAPIGTVFPSGYKTFPGHCVANDGSERNPIIFDEPLVVGRTSDRKS